MYLLEVVEAPEELGVFFSFHEAAKL